MTNSLTPLTNALADYHASTGPVTRASAELADAVAEFLAAARVPATVHLVGVPGQLADAYDMDDEGSEQRVVLAFADPRDAEQWTNHHNTTVPWTPSTKVSALGEVAYVPSGAMAPPVPQS
ncbi:hypothetical protein [Nocardia neocaledoniensis]|uniref:hypothetical protein n=1 Tax=Nocardia neocaledoniensis TaxID=236511 RepID=UPI00245809DF|nr:hypothetical protein [Nocardia neocaledoniensis]